MTKINKKYIIFLVMLSLLFGGTAGLLGSLIFLPSWCQSNNSLVANTDDSASAVARVIDSVVSITVGELVADYSMVGAPVVENETPNSASPPTPQMVKQVVAGGTGFIVSSDGYILTNKHVVPSDTLDYQVTLNEGSQYVARIVDKDFNNDLAILKIDVQDLPVATLGDSASLKLGQTVLAIGYTLGEYENTVTRGIVSGINRNIVAGDYAVSGDLIDGAIQTDTAVNLGNSGGPLINLRGEVVGINTAINSEGQAIGFALPINIAKPVIASVIASGHIIRPWLGVRYIVVDDSVAAARNLPINYGALILAGESASVPAVVPGSPADLAGLESGDIILSVAGVTLERNSLTAELQKYQPSDEVVLKILRGREEKNVSIRLVERPDDL
jgi:S1-C subfamily serine protease